MLKQTEIIKFRCPNCKKRMKLQSFFEENDGCLRCPSCGYQCYFQHNCVYLADNPISRQKLENKKDKLGRSFDIYKTQYGSFVEKSQYMDGSKKSIIHLRALKNVLSLLKKCSNFTLYILIFTCVFFYFLLFKKKQKKTSYEEKIIKNLSMSYFYVPEMALWKYFEIVAIRSVLEEKINLGKIMDIGGGNGIVFSQIHSGLKSNTKINSDLMTFGFSEYDLNLLEDFEKTIIDDNQLDFLISVNSLEHIPNVQASLHEAERILKSGGKFIFTTPKNNYVHSHPIYKILKSLRLHNFAKKYQHWERLHSHNVSVNTERGWDRLIEKAGFKSCKILDIFPSNTYLIVELLNISAKIGKNWNFWNTYYQISERTVLPKIITSAMIRFILKRTANQSSVNNSHLLIICSK